MLSAATVRMMIAVRVMDPPGDRKAHASPTPKGGGVGVVVTFLVGIAVLYRSPRSPASPIHISSA